MATEKRSKGGGLPSGHRAPTSSVSYRGVPSESANIDLMDRTLSLRRTFNVSWWERRSRIEKKLIISVPFLILLTVLIIVIFAVVVANQSRSSTVGTKGNSSMPKAGAHTTAHVPTCVTWDCVQTAASIMDSINRSIDPCEDFFEYACGSRPQFPPGTMGTHFARIQDEQEQSIKGLLETPVSDDEVEAIRKAKKLYKLCLKEPMIEFMPKRLWLSVFMETGSPSLLDMDQWNRTDFDLTHFLARLRLLLMIDGLFTMYVDADAKNSNRNVIYFDQPRNIPRSVPKFDLNLTLSKESGNVLMTTPYPSTTNNSSSPSPSSSSTTNTTSSSTTNTTSSSTTNTTSYSYFASPVADGLKQVAEFGDELRKILVPESQRRYHHLLYNRMTVADMYSNLTNEIDWLQYLRIIFSAVNITIELDEHVVIVAPDYFVKLGQLLNRTSSKVIVGYLFWSARLEQFDFFTSHQEDFRRNQDTIDDSLSAMFQWRVCTSVVKQHLGMAVSRMFLDTNFNKDRKETVEQFVGEIKAAFYELVDEANWMDDNSKELVKEKMSFMKARIAFPDYIFNDTELNEMYKNIVIQPKNFTETITGIIQIASKQSIDRLRKPVDRRSWATLPIIVNAFYMSIRNEIIIPASVIQTPFYREINFPSALNFGGIGFVIGHEVIHGFGDRGRQYDKGGNLTVWWSQELTDKFSEHATCLVEQYSNYTVSQSKIQIDGLQTLGENIADNGGLRQSFRAYRRWLKQGREEDLLPGLNLTGNQLYFLQFAQVMCSRVEFESYGQSPTRTDRHCPSEIRVLGTLSNSDDFAQAYGCKAGSRMNPVRKCVLW